MWDKVFPGKEQCEEILLWEFLEGWHLQKQHLHFWYSFLKVGLQAARDRAVLPLTPSKAAHLSGATNTVRAAQQEDKQMRSDPGDMIIPTAWLLFQMIPVCPH